MFVTVVLFKLLYPKLVQLAGFTVKGREWIANGFVSATISVLTFQVYANMTRFEWAYPSGTEHHINQWISGQTMVLNTIIMNMVYLIAETRSRVGEPGINDPNVKLCVTAFTFMTLWVLQDAEVIDPSVLNPRNTSVVAAHSDVSLPLSKVCLMKSRAMQGYLGFTAITAFSLGFVIFGTSAQTLSGLRSMCGCQAQRSTITDASASAKDPSLRSSPQSRNSVSVDDEGRSVPPRAAKSFDEHLKGQLLLFAIFATVILFIVLFFATVPLYSHTGTRNDTAWKDACDNYDQSILDQYGLS
mmetsp:Transcript_53299/g.137846  ORF Transcript_53299/g.137846 Transcript_53299/m.137846 type:complete len:300 (+) Transcript_53299:44-943(+)